MASPTKFSLSINLEYELPEAYEPKVSYLELVSNALTRFSLSVSNPSNQTFPGCKMRVQFEEHGSSPTDRPLRWGLTEGLTVPPLANNSSWKGDFQFQPLLEGLFIINLSIESEAREDGQTADIELRARTGVGRQISYYFRVLPREALDLRADIERLRQLAEKREI